ncbi:MAG: DUF188 domain-containing protein [Candidatus Aegiribacteria sp.]|nr:DUF188 domain-containing protein [Candidatus Aegiribacteria sp.]
MISFLSHEMKKLYSDLLHDLREQGMMIGGPKPFAKKDRSRFLQELDKMVVKIRRRNGINP